MSTRDLSAAWTARVVTAEPAEPRNRVRVRARVFVRGRVQGVWFRESCREQAVALAVAGWVRNLADGRVEAVFEGPDAAVTRMVAWCQDGPPRARVDGVEVQHEESTGEPGFHVR